MRFVLSAGNLSALPHQRLASPTIVRTVRTIVYRGSNNINILAQSRIVRDFREIPIGENVERTIERKLSTAKL